MIEVEWGTRRCPACGRRVRADAAGCPVHGPLDARAPTPALPAPPTVPGYVVERALARGGFATIYLARTGADDELVLKVAAAADAATRDRFAQETAALRAIGRPHAPAIFDEGVLDDGTAFIAMERIAHPTLAQHMLDGPTPLSALGTVAHRLLHAVGAAHSSGLVHRDLKPENLFLGEEHATLIDFGLALDRGVDAGERLTTSRTVMGTAEYMAPEQCAGRPDVDARADIYALGVILYELLTAQPPFFGSPGDVRQAHLARRPAPPSTLTPVPDAVEHVVLTCLAKDPADRFADVATLAAALEHALTDATAARPVAVVSDESAAARAPRKRRTVGLVFVHAEASTQRMAELFEGFGGVLGAASGHSFVGVFDEQSASNPGRGALRAAEHLIEQGVCSAAIVDSERVSVRTSADGSTRFFSRAFSRPESFPQPQDHGVLVTRRLADVVRDLDGAMIEQRADVLRIVRANADGPMAPTPIVDMLGREDVLQDLVDSAFDATDSGVPTIATLLAEPGYGKSRLCAALLADLPDMVPGARLLHVRAREPLGGEAYHTLRALLDGILSPPPGITAIAGKALLRARLGDEVATAVWPGVALSLGWVEPDDPDVRAFAAAPGALRAKAAQGAGEAMRRLASAQPLVLVLDDAQFADEASLDAIEYATLAEAGAPIWVAAFARPSLERARPTWGRRAGASDRFELEPLPKGSAFELLRTLLQPAEQIPQEVLETLYQRTVGVPLLLIELASGLKRRGLIRRRDRGEAWFVATDELARVPDSPLVEWLARGELESLPPELAAHARLISLLGAEVGVDELAAILRRLDRAGAGSDFPLDASIGTRRLLAAGVVVEPTPGRVSFRHALFRETIAAATPPAQQALIHEAAFVYYRDATELAAEHRLPRLAYQASRSGHRSEAAAAFLELARQARARHAYLDSEHMFDRALAHLDETPSAQRLEAVHGRGRARHRLTQLESACSDFRLARSLAAALGERHREVEVLLDEAEVLDWRDEWQRSRERVEEAAQLLAGIETPLASARLALAEGRSLFRFSRGAEARELLERAASDAESLGDAGYETFAVALVLLGYELAGLGELDGSAAAFERVIPAAEQRGDQWHLAAALNNRYRLWVARNERGRLTEDLGRVAKIGRELGFDRMEWFAHFNLAEALYRLEDLDAALEHAAKAVDVDESSLGDAGRPLGKLLHSRILAFKGERNVARRTFQIIRAHQNKAADDATLVPADQVLLSMVDLLTRSATGDEWAALTARAREHCAGPELLEVLEARGVAASRAGDSAAAVAAFAAALEAAASSGPVTAARLQRALEAARSA